MDGAKKNEWNKERYWTFAVRVKKEYQKLILEKCAFYGVTPSRYVNLLMERDIEGFESIGEATKKGDKRK